MSEELGRIEKPLADDFKRGRKLYFVPLIFSGEDSHTEYVEKFNRYWDEVENQVGNLELKLGKINKIYHELITISDEGGVNEIEELNISSYRIAKNRLDKGAQIEPIEERELLTEFMDWSRCLAMGLQNQKVLSHIYELYVDAGKKRNEYIAGEIDRTLKTDEIGILFMREGHQVQFPTDIQIFYVAPPALDEIKRWARDYEAKLRETKPESSEE